ncbi:MAG: M28 family metallopeptidase [Candidatus Thalassarchaeum sp.]
MSARKVTSILITGIVVLAGFLAAVVFLSINWLDSMEDQLLEEELKEIPPPTWPIPSVVVNDIETLADFGYRKIDTVAHANAGDFIQFRFEDLGYEVEVQNFTTELCEDCRNYVATIEGENPDSWIVVGGHYDAICYSQQIIIGIEYPGCTSQGAYDDATGVASVLELARLMKEWQQLAWDELDIELKPKHTWKFAAWDYEEWQGSGSPEGAGYGSETFVTTLPDGVEIATYINLDMYGLNWPVETQLVSQLSGCDEDYFHLYLFTSPVDDWSYYEDRGLNVTDEMREQATLLQERLGFVLHEELQYPSEWVVVLDDTKGNSDHYNFISRGWPATWFRGMHEYLQEEDDTCEQSPKHAPTDRVDVVYSLAGGRSGFEAGMQTGLDALASLMWMDVQGSWDLIPTDAAP